MMLDVDERLQRVFREVFDDDTLVLDIDTGPDDVRGWDSLGSVSLLYALEAEFGVIIEDGDVAGLRTVGEIDTYLAGRTP